MAKTQSAAKSATSANAAVVAGAAKSPKAARKVPAGTMSAQTKLVDASKDKHEVTEEQRHNDRRADDKLKSENAMKFAMSQLSGGNDEEKAKRAKFEEELKALQEKHGVQVQVKVKAARADKVQQNGVTRPGATTLCGKVWAAADEISHKIHGVASIAALKEHPTMAGVNDHTVKTQYAKWRLFNGISGRLPRIHAVHQVEGTYEGIPTIDKVTPVASAPEAPAETPKSE